jgi:hypothetical protein
MSNIVGVTGGFWYILSISCSRGGFRSQGSHHLLNPVPTAQDNVLEPIPGATGNYQGRHLEVSPCGQVVFLKGTKTLAGSSVSQHHMFKNLVNVLDVSIPVRLIS